MAVYGMSTREAINIAEGNAKAPRGIPEPGSLLNLQTGEDSDGRALPNFANMAGGFTKVAGFVTSVFYTNSQYRWTQTWVQDANGSTWSAFVRTTL